jgi:hypothetical protein
LTAYQKRPTSSAQGTAGIKKDIVVKNVAQGVKRKFCHVKTPCQGPFIQGLDIGEKGFVKREPLHIDEAMGHGMKNKGIIGAGRKT